MMKYSKITQLVLGFLFLIPALTFAQPDQGLNFQAIARDSKGDLLSSEKIDLLMTIQKAPKSKFGSPTTLYQEEHIDVLTDKFGVFSTVIGTGKILVGSFTNIDWKTGNIQVEVSCKFPGATQYSPIGTVPLQYNYKAYHAQIADSVEKVHLSSLSDVSIIPSMLNSGDVLTWDGSKWVNTTPVTSHKIFLGPANFSPMNNQTSYWISSVGANLNSGTGIIQAPINLPVGSYITSFKAHFRDNSTGDLQIKVYRSYMGSSSTEPVAFTTTSGASSSYREQNIPLVSPVYGNVPDNYFLFIEVSPASGSTWNSNLKIRAIEIDYNLPE